MKTAQPSAGQTNAACCCIFVPLQNKHLKKKEKLPEHIQKYLDEEEKVKTELAEEKKSKLQTRQGPERSLRAKRRR